jgi:hypothetical protein
MAGRLLAAVSQLKLAECEKLGQLARFDTNELVPVDLHAMAVVLP